MLGLTNLVRFNKTYSLVIISSVALYSSFAYDLARTDFTKLILLYIALFVFAYQLVEKSGLNFKFLVGLGLLFRFIFLLATPNLSQDFYRFIWDGQMLLEGFNPYLYTPDQIMNQASTKIPLAQELYTGMGALSASHFTNYPPLNQLCFALATLFSSKSILGSVIVMRLIIIAADFGVLYFGKKLLEALKIPSKRILWYFLNPFIIIELIGNLHFEGVMLCFLIWSLYLLHFGKWQWAAVVFACSISTKLIPLMFLPLFFRWFNSDKTKKTPEFKGMTTLILFYAIIGIITLLYFLPFFSMEFIVNYSKTVGLWFNDFEFNASIYYIARAIGYFISGYNEIAIIGKILPVVILLIILGLTFLKHNNTLQKLITSMLLALACYLFLSTTVHPWYIATLVGLSVFTHYRFPLVWSLVIVLSYFAYSDPIYKENLWIIAFEYSIVFGTFAWEVILKRKLPVS